MLKRELGIRTCNNHNSEIDTSAEVCYPIKKSFSVLFIGFLTSVLKTVRLGHGLSTTLMDPVHRVLMNS